MNWINEIKINTDRALKIIYDDHRKNAINWIISEFKLCEYDSDEIFQASIVILYDNVITGKLTNLDSSLKTYLFAIIRNKVIQFNRAKNKSQELNSFDLIDDFIDEEYEDIEREKLKKAEKAMIEIGDPCKSLLELFYYKQKKIEELTLIFGYKNNETTKNLKYKCLKRLQKIIFE